MTISLAAVFIPVLFMGGVLGRLLHEFAIIIGVAVLVSGVVSLTLTPMLCSRFLRPPHGGHSRLYQASERVFDGMLKLYDVTLRWTLAHRRFTMAVLLATFVTTAYLFVIIPKGFIPNEDNGTVFAFTEAGQDVSFDSMMAHQRAVADVVRKQPYVEQFMSFIGASGSSTLLNNGRIFMRLKPRDQRPSAEEVIADLRPKLAAVPGMRVYPQILPTIRIGGQLTKAVYQYTLQDADLAELYQWAPRPVRQAAPAPRPAGREQRSADHQPADRGGHRSRQGLHAGDQRRSDRDRAGRRLRRAADLHDLHALQPVLGHPRGRPGVPAGSHRAGPPVTCAPPTDAWCRWTRSPG